MKISVIIPTFNHLEDCLKPCIESLLKYTDLIDKEVIIVANGCNDGTKEYVESLGYPFKLVWFNDALGYIKSTNKGIKQAQGDYIILLNNDIILLDQEKDTWIDTLMKPFEQYNKVGLTGAWKLRSDVIDRDFLLFFCVMIKREVIDNIGLLDEIFGLGYSEDVDFCVRAADAGYLVQQVPNNTLSNQFFPIYHPGNRTFVELEGNNELLQSNRELLYRKYSLKTPKVSIIIPTYNHLEDYLKPCIESVIKYTDLADKEVIIVANGCKDDTRAYVESLGYPFKLIWFNDALGYTKATNEGIKVSKGEFILLLNNDSEVLCQEKDYWINILLDPFVDEKMGIVGPLENYCPYIEDTLIVFGCAMIRRKLFDKLGLLDEIFSPGYGEDSDICMKARKIGYKVMQWPSDKAELDQENQRMLIQFPLNHKGAGTFDNNEERIKIIERNSEILRKRWGKNKILYSIIIPNYTYPIKECIESLIQYTELNNIEVIIVANGASEETRKYITKLGEPFKLLWFDEPIGYTKAVNEGIKVSKGKFIILLNDDIVFLPQEKNDWIVKLRQPFNIEEKVGVTGIDWAKWNSGLVNRTFVAFWCAMIDRKTIDTAGLLDEIFNPGFCEDSDFCYRAELLDFKICQVKDIAIHHENHQTMHQDALEHKNRNENNMGIMNSRYFMKSPFKKPQISIIIPTYNHLEDCLKPCINSIVNNTDLRDIEVIIVANGCTDGTREYVDYLESSFRLIWFDEPQGYTCSINQGIKYALGDYVILLNNDCELLPQESNSWIRMLLDPFKDDKIGITGAKLKNCPVTQRDFLIFFLVAIRREVIEKIGILDEIFNPGFGEDSDYCFRCVDAGYQILDVNIWQEGDLDHYAGSFPVYHKAEQTVHENPEWENIVNRNYEILRKRYNKIPQLMNNVNSVETLDNQYSEKWSKKSIMKKTYPETVTAVISTKNRYFSTLPLAIASICNQTRLPEELILFDDTDEADRKDLRLEPIYQTLFCLLNEKHIKWKVFFGECKGQVLNHQKSINMCETEMIYRIDDDDILEASCLEKLLEVMEDDVGAVASLAIDPKLQIPENAPISGKLEDIYTACNVQWTKQTKELTEVDHLNNTFLYRKRASEHGYCLGLSPAGHREETIFTYEMKRNGWRLLVNPKAIAWHCKYTTGGIRSFKEKENWDFDEQVFRRKIALWNYIPPKHKMVLLDNGLGDHYGFKSILKEFKEKYKDIPIVIGVCYPDVFAGEDVILIPLDDGKLLVNHQLDPYNIYKMMYDGGWQGNLVDAFRKMYL